MFRNSALKNLFIFNGIFVFASSLLGPLYAVYVETIQTDVIAVSLSWSVFLFSTTIFTLLVRSYGDRVKEKEYLLALGYLVRAVVWAVFPFVQTLAILIALQVLLGLGEALGTPAFSAIFAEHLDEGEQIKEYADWKLISNIAGALGVLLGGIIVGYGGFFVLFFVMSGLAAIVFLGVIFMPRQLL